MAVNYVNSLKESRLDAVVTAIGAGGKLEIGTSGMASVLATFTLADPAGTTADDTLTFSGFPDTVQASASGTAAEARIRTSADADVVTGLTVGTDTEDIVLDNTSISENQDVTLSSATITHA